MALGKDFLESSTINAESIEDVDLQKINTVLNENSFARITGLFSKSELKASVEKIGDLLDIEKDAPTTGEPTEAVYGNFQKFSIGAAKHGKVNRPRFMRTIYNPIWSEDIYGMRKHFIKLAQLRNLLAGKPIDYAVEDVTDGMWTAARIHHFPSGGGFMVAHKDTVLPAEYERRGIGGYYQILLLLTEKGDEFETGGGFITALGEEFAYEDYCERGDVVIYNATTLHGVNDVDVTAPFRQNSIRGRMSALVTLYTDQR